VHDDCGKKNLGGRNGKIPPMMLAKADAVDADFVGEHGPVDNIADHLRMRQR
jgi:hypothetical protein